MGFRQRVRKEDIIPLLAGALLLIVSAIVACGFALAIGEFTNDHFHMGWNIYWRMCCGFVVILFLIGGSVFFAKGVTTP